jgi:hypothetical protein
MAFTVGELSRLTGLTVRALHHYDEIGLVRPSQRTAAGYRLYDDADALRLQQVLVLRELRGSRRPSTARPGRGLPGTSATRSRPPRERTGEARAVAGLPVIGAAQREAVPDHQTAVDGALSCASGERSGQR